MYMTVPERERPIPRFRPTERTDSARGRINIRRPDVIPELRSEPISYMSKEYKEAEQKAAHVPVSRDACSPRAKAFQTPRY